MKTGLKISLILVLSIIIILPAFGTGGQEVAPPKIVVYHHDWGFQREDDQKIADIVNEKLGIELEYIIPPLGQELDMLNLMLASGEQVDIFMHEGIKSQVITWWSKDLLYDLTDPIDKWGPNLNARINSELWRFVKDAHGSTFAIPSELQRSTWTIDIRTDWLKKVGLSMPKTIDDYEKILEAFKSSNLTEYPLYDNIFAGRRLPASERLLAKAFSPAGCRWWKDSSGEVLPPELHPKYKDFLAKMQEWYVKGYFHPEAFTLKEMPLKELCAQNKIGVWNNWYTMTFAPMLELKKVVPDAEYQEVIPPLSGPAGKGGVAAEPPVGYYVCVNKNTKNIQKVIEFLDYYVTQEGHDLMFYGIEGEHYTIENRVVKYPYEERKDFKYFIGLHIFDCAKNSIYLSTQYYAVKSKEVLDNVLNKPEYTLYYDVDVEVPYDFSQTKTADVLVDIETFRDEAWLKVVTGQKPVSWWDEAMKEWLKIGMDQYIKDRNEQYQAFYK